MQTGIVRNLCAFALTALIASAAFAAPKYVWEASTSSAGFNDRMSNSDLINGTVPIKNNELAGVAPGYVPVNVIVDGCEPSPLDSPHFTEEGFHSATPDKTGAGLTDGIAGLNNTDSILEDFRWPAAVFQFDLDAPSDIGEIRVFAANDDRDGRVFQDYDVEISTDTNPQTKLRAFTPLITQVISSDYVCFGPGTGDGFNPNGNHENSPVRLGATLTRVFDDANPVLAANVTSIRFTFYPVDNTQGVFWDRWLGPIGCEDKDLTTEQLDPQDHDGQKRPFVSSVIKEIDVLAARDPFEDCTNGTDDDGDGAVDAADNDCFGRTCPPENCTNGTDDTGEGLVDCDDPDCLGELVCMPEICDNGVDDNGDTLVDCDDPQCANLPICLCDNPVFDVAGSGDENDEPDGAVDLLDFAVFQRCISSGGGDFNSLPQVCRCMDKTGPGGAPDQVIDGNDLGIFLQCNTGPAPATPVDPACDDPPAQ